MVKNSGQIVVKLVVKIVVNTRAQLQSKNQQPFGYSDAAPAAVNASLYRQLYQSTFPVPGWAAGAEADPGAAEARLCGLRVDELLAQAYLLLPALSSNQS